MNEIKTSQRLISGILTLLFAIAFTFVFAEERQRGLAILIAVPLAASLIWYAYLRFMAVDKREGKSEYSGLKSIVTAFAIISIVVAIGSSAVKSKIGIFFIPVFLIFIIVYEILDCAETTALKEKTDGEIKHEEV